MKTKIIAMDIHAKKTATPPSEIPVTKKISDASSITAAGKIHPAASITPTMKSERIEIDEYEKIGDAWLAYMNETGGLEAHFIIPKDMPGRAHSYLFTLLKHLEIMKDSEAYDQVVQKVGFSYEQLMRMYKKPNEKNSYILELVVLNYMKAFFSDESFAEITRNVEDVGFKTGNLEYAPSKTGSWKTRLFHMYIIFKNIGTHSRIKSTISHGKSRNLESLVTSFVKKKMGALVQFYFDSVPTDYFGKKVISYPGLNRPTKLVVTKEMARKYEIDPEKKEFDPSRESVFGQGLVLPDTLHMARSICEGTLNFKHIRTDSKFATNRFPACVDQFVEWGHDEETGKALRYHMNHDGTFSDQFDRLLYTVDAHGQLTDIPAHYLLRDHAVLCDGVVFILNSFHAEIEGHFQNATILEKLRWNASEQLQKPIEKITTRDIVRTVYERNKLKLFVLPVTAGVVYLWNILVGFSANLLAAVCFGAAFMILNIFGHLYEKKRVEDIENNIQLFKQAQLTKARDSKKNELLQKTLEENIQARTLSEHEKQTQMAIVNSLTEALVLVDMNKTVTFYNKSFGIFMQVSGLQTKRNELNGKTLEEIFHFNLADYNTKFMPLFNAAVATKKRQEAILELAFFGETIYIETKVNPILDAKGNVEMMIMVLGDKTQTKKLEIEKTQAREAEKAVNARKDVLIGAAAPVIRELLSNVDIIVRFIEDQKNQTQQISEAVQLFSEIRPMLQSAHEKYQAFLTIINDISDKSNLLSLNAAIEAARAGEMGKGFAVVAKEISKLADLTQKEADATAQQIAEIGGLIETVGANAQALLDFIDQTLSATTTIEPIAGKVKAAGLQTSEAVEGLSALYQSSDDKNEQNKEQAQAKEKDKQQGPEQMQEKPA